jgi:hypothetical protein
MKERTVMKNKNLIIFLGGLIFLVILLMILFAGKGLLPTGDDTITKYAASIADFPASLVSDWNSHSLLGSAGRFTPMIPTYFTRLISNPFTSHLSGYVLNVLFVFIAMVYFLRGKKLSWIACVGGGIAMALSGYFFTLVSAGHRGIFQMMPWAILMFSTVDRGFRNRQIFYFGITALCIAWGFPNQPDIMGMFILVLAPYALFRIVQEFRIKDSNKHLIITTIAGATFATIIFAMAAFQTVDQLVNVTMKGRDKQLNSGETVIASQTKSAEQAEQKNWIFCTNWSLPPADALEFVAPFIYGVETGNKTYPYWGKIGQTYKWETHHQGLFNLRQHTVYIGAIQLVFAIFALSMLVSYYRRKEKPNESLLSNNKNRGELLFWLITLLIVLLLSFGRYCPLYKLFYMIPGVNKIRCPIKFVHICNLAISILFAYGIDLFIENYKAKKNKFTIVFGYVCLIISVIMLIAAGTTLKSTAFAEQLNLLGLSGLSANLIKIRSFGFFFSFMTFAFCGLLFQLVYYIENPNIKKYLPYLIVLAVGIEMSVVDKYFINRQPQMIPLLEENYFVKSIKSDNELYRVSCPTQEAPFSYWKRFTFPMNLINVSVPTKIDTLAEDYQNFYKVGFQDTARLWQLTNTKYIIAPKRGVMELIKSGKGFKLQTTFDVNNNMQVKPPTIINNGQFAIAKYENALPRAAMYYNWKTMPREDMLSMLVSNNWNPQESVLVTETIEDSTDALIAPSPVEIVKYKPNKIVIKVDAKQNGVLLLNDKFNSEWKVKVDGKSTDIFEANYIMRGVKVDAGKHTVIMTYAPYMNAFLMQLLGLLILLGLTIFSTFKGLKKR